MFRLAETKAETKVDTPADRLTAPISVLLAVVAVALVLVLFPLRSASAEGGELRRSHFTCSLDIALRANDASAAVASGTTRSPDNEGSSSKFNAKTKKSIVTAAASSDLYHANLIGSGIANCKNQQGFQFDLPAVIAIAVNADQELPVQALRASIEPLSVDRDVNMIFDNYAPHVELRNTPSASAHSSSERAVVVKGAKNDILMQINLNVPAEFTSKVNVARVDLKFDSESLPAVDQK